MNSPVSLKAALILFFLLFCLSFVKAQNAAPQKDTTRVILVVTPGQTTATPAATAPSAKNYPAAPPTTTYPTPPANYSAPNLSERSARPTYMQRGTPKKAAVQQTTANGANQAVSTSQTSSAISQSATTNQSSATLTKTTITTTTTTTGNKVTVKKDTTVVKKDTAIVKKDTTAIKKDSIKANDDSSVGVNTKIVFFELGGPGLALTLNYDARIGHKVNGWGFRAGAGYYADGYGNSVTTVPLQVNYLYGNGPHFLELGAGTTFLNSYGSNTGKTFIFDRVTGFIGTATIGYRFQSPDKRLNFRLAFVPIFYDEGVIPAGGLSVGYTFK